MNASFVARRDCKREAREKLWGDAFWTPSFFAASTGGAPIDTLKLYVQSQQTKAALKGRGFHPAILMKFSRVDPNVNYLLERWESETGQWNVGLAPVIFGMRVRAGPVDNEVECAIDYCAGADRKFQMLLLSVIIAILEKMPESVGLVEVQRAMPRMEMKPVNKDGCWDKLQAMAAKDWKWSGAGGYAELLARLRPPASR
jgi:hypothetical protein